MMVPETLAGGAAANSPDPSRRSRVRAGQAVGGDPRPPPDTAPKQNNRAGSYSSVFPPPRTRRRVARRRVRRELTRREPSESSASSLKFSGAVEPHLPQSAGAPGERRPPFGVSVRPRLCARERAPAAPMSGAKTGAIFRPQTNAAGETCSYCKLVGVRNPGAVVLTACGACRRLRRVRVLYCSRKCQRGAWPRHRVACGASPWSAEQHACHRPATRHYVARLTQEVMIYTLFWRREPSYTRRLFLGRVLPSPKAGVARPPRGAAAASASGAARAGTSSRTTRACRGAGCATCGTRTRRTAATWRGSRARWSARCCGGGRRTSRAASGASASSPSSSRTRRRRRAGPRLD